MSRLLVCACSVAVAVMIGACSSGKKAPTSSATNQSAQTGTKQPPAAGTTQPTSSQPGELQPGQASGTYTAKGQVVELKYAYAGRVERFGSPSIVILLTDKPIPPEAVAEELKSTPLLEGEKVHGLEYSIDENSMWIRFHPGQYQESTANKLKDYKVENDIVSGVDENDGSLSEGRYARKVKFVAAINK